MKITFPNKTAKQIVEECDNKLGTGKLLYSIDWYKKEKFYTTETCRERTIEVSDDIEHYGKSWNECKELVGEENMLNFPEMIFLIKTYFEKTGKYPEENQYKYSWTSSRSSYGRLVGVGGCASGGVLVGLVRPVYSYSLLGVRSIRSAVPLAAKPEQGEADYRNLEIRVKKLEDIVTNIKSFLVK